MQSVCIVMAERILLSIQQPMELCWLQRRNRNQYYMMILPFTRYSMIAVLDIQKQMKPCLPSKFLSILDWDDHEECWFSL